MKTDFTTLPETNEKSTGSEINFEHSCSKHNCDILNVNLSPSSRDTYFIPSFIIYDDFLLFIYQNGIYLKKGSFLRFSSHKSCSFLSQNQHLNLTLKHSCAASAINLNNLFYSPLKILGVSESEFMDQMGVYFVNFVSQYGYDRVLSVLGRHMRDFLNGLDNLHEYLKFSYPLMR